MEKEPSTHRNFEFIAGFDLYYKLKGHKFKNIMLLS